MNRRNFTRRSLVATIGLLTGADAVEAFERLTHRRRHWPGYRPSQFRSVRSGDWHDPATWAGGWVPPQRGPTPENTMGVMPGTEADATIVIGHEVTVNEVIGHRIWQDNTGGTLRPCPDSYFRFVSNGVNGAHWCDTIAIGEAYPFIAYGDSH